ncbi:hypothetical protein FVE85_5250 [Porphyridium purpureum]|uniref:Uncharacterized protein n=1 Tax=Porphyridium purpureum TaxID=35688 RepID=A0A5J4Z304_PORPP|nr:hypothetical protein FVE85_5250 [Porphyridium purpureum]|eukprot:POR5204..scf295_1
MGGTVHTQMPCSAFVVVSATGRWLEPPAITGAHTGVVRHCGGYRYAATGGATRQRRNARVFSVRMGITQKPPDEEIRRYTGEWGKGSAEPWWVRREKKREYMLARRRKKPVDYYKNAYRQEFRRHRRPFEGSHEQEMAEEADPVIIERFRRRVLSYLLQNGPTLASELADACAQPRTLPDLTAWIVENQDLFQLSESSPSDAAQDDPLVSLVPGAEKSDRALEVLIRSRLGPAQDPEACQLFLIRTASAAQKAARVLGSKRIVGVYAHTSGKINKVQMIAITCPRAASASDDAYPLGHCYLFDFSATREEKDAVALREAVFSVLEAGRITKVMLDAQDTRNAVQKHLKIQVRNDIDLRVVYSLLLREQRKEGAEWQGWDGMMSHWESTMVGKYGFLSESFPFRSNASKLSLFDQVSLCLNNSKYLVRLLHLLFRSAELQKTKALWRGAFSATSAYHRSAREVEESSRQESRARSSIGASGTDTQVAVVRILSTDGAMENGEEEWLQDELALSRMLNEREGITPDEHHKLMKGSVLYSRLTEDIFIRSREIGNTCVRALVIGASDESRNLYMMALASWYGKEQSQSVIVVDSFGDFDADIVRGFAYHVQFPNASGSGSVRSYLHELMVLVQHTRATVVLLNRVSCFLANMDDRDALKDFFDFARKAGVSVIATPGSFSRHEIMSSEVLSRHLMVHSDDQNAWTATIELPSELGKVIIHRHRNAENGDAEVRWLARAFNGKVLVLSSHQSSKRNEHQGTRKSETKRTDQMDDLVARQSVPPLLAKIYALLDGDLEPRAFSKQALERRLVLEDEFMYMQAQRALRQSEADGTFEVPLEDMMDPDAETPLFVPLEDVEESKGDDLLFEDAAGSPVAAASFSRAIDPQRFFEEDRREAEEEEQQLARKAGVTAADFYRASEDETRDDEGLREGLHDGDESDEERFFDSSRRKEDRNWLNFMGINVLSSSIKATSRKPSAEKNDTDDSDNNLAAFRRLSDAGDAPSSAQQERTQNEAKPGSKGVQEYVQMHTYTDKLEEASMQASRALASESFSASERAASNSEGPLPRMPISFSDLPSVNVDMFLDEEARESSLGDGRSPEVPGALGKESNREELEGIALSEGPQLFGMDTNDGTLELSRRLKREAEIILQPEENDDFSTPAPGFIQELLGEDENDDEADEDTSRMEFERFERNNLGRARRLSSQDEEDDGEDWDDFDIAFADQTDARNTAVRSELLSTDPDPFEDSELEMIMANAEGFSLDDQVDDGSDSDYEDDFRSFVGENKSALTLDQLRQAEVRNSKSSTRNLRSPADDAGDERNDSDQVGQQRDSEEGESPNPPVSKKTLRNRMRRSRGPMYRRWDSK